ncbi:DNA-binding protein [bacterium]|nr:DNA-binding protein [bacterium]
MHYGIIGSGMVAQSLAKGLLKYGHRVTVGSRDAQKQLELASAIEGIETAGFPETAERAEALILAVKGSAALDALGQCGAGNIRGKLIIDATNPIEAAPPTQGVLKFFTTLDESLMERLQNAFPEAHFVKAFNSIGNAHMVDPDFGAEKPTMFICGNDATSKATTRVLLEQFGWEVEDLGSAPSARAIEPLCMLWCIPGMLEGRWNHAFRLLKKP